MRNSLFLVGGFALVGLLTACHTAQTVTKTTEIKPQTPTTMPATKHAPDWAKNCNIYEVNVRQYTKEGTFKAFEAHIPRLKRMGVDVLWFMPIQPIGIKNRKG